MLTVVGIVYNACKFDRVGLPVTLLTSDFGQGFVGQSYPGDTTLYPPPLLGQI